MSIGVIIPTYNDSAFLRKAIPSVLRQKTECQIIVVDDGSTVPLDVEVVELCRLHGCMRIQMPKNRGLSAARNMGISSYVHDFYLPLDADDVLLPGGLDGLVAAIDDDHDIFYGNVVVKGHVDKPVPQPWTPDIWRVRNPLFCSSLFRRSVWERVGGYLEREGPHYEDYRYWATAWVRGCRFKYVDVNVYDHTERTDSMLRQLHPNREFYHNLAIEPLRELG